MLVQLRHHYGNLEMNLSALRIILGIRIDRISNFKAAMPVGRYVFALLTLDPMLAKVTLLYHFERRDVLLSHATLQAITFKGRGCLILLSPDRMTSR